MSTDDIVRQFAQHESDFKLARDNYTYSQEVLVEDVAPNPGEYRLDSDIVFTPQGRRYEQITYAPQPSLHDFTLSPEDMKDLENIQPFVLTLGRSAEVRHSVRGYREARRTEHV